MVEVGGGYFGWLAASIVEARGGLVFKIWNSVSDVDGAKYKLGFETSSLLYIWGVDVSFLEPVYMMMMSSCSASSSCNNSLNVCIYEQTAITFLLKNECG